tara:strand:+ start:138 stop:551 length:414 start_codon:yes stop_codon:yes gene_type:complete
MSVAKIRNFVNLSIILKKKIQLILIFLNQKKYLFYFFILAIFFVIYALILNQVKSYTISKENNFNSFFKSNEFNNLKEYIFENLNSPYREYNYTVENNDTIEKVLKKYDIENSEINKIASEIKKKNYLIYMLVLKLK